MTDVEIQVVRARRLAAVRRRVEIGTVGTAWRPALDQVWAFLRDHPGLRTDGHNVFVYRPVPGRDSLLDVDFGVEVTRDFEAADGVIPTATPVGEAVTAVHVGGYDQLHRTHEALQTWRVRTGRTFTGTSWELYGDWSDDPSTLETEVFYLLG